MSSGLSRILPAAGLLLTLAASAPSVAQTLDASELWRDASTKSFQAPADLPQMPSRFRTLELDVATLEALLATLANDGSGAAPPAAEISLPLPEGGYGRFLIYESSILAPALATKFPDLRSYAGRGLDDPSATVRLDWSEHGFHAIILSASASTFVAPRNAGDRIHHLSYDFRDVPPVQWVEPEIVRPPTLTPDSKHPSEDPDAKATTTSGSILRIFRLAVTASGDYTQQNGGTVASAMAAIHSKINQLNAIWEREAAIRFVIVADNDQLIFTDPATDPFIDECNTNELTTAQTTVDNLLGSEHYDIHHLFLRNYCGGVVGGSMCIDGQKGRGQTGVGIPIDILAHEVGHQYTMSHTWSLCNGGTGSQYAGDSAYEPGSGDSIMSYAGICGVDNLINTRTLQYHVRSLDQKTSHLATQLDCGASFQIANTAPVPAGGSTLFTLPRSTPFVLNGSGSDAEGDPMTYSWEQFDLPDPEPPSDPGSAPNNGEPPFFRRFPEQTAPTRTFPQISDVINGTESLGEELPDHARTLTMRLVAKDNAPGGGGVAYDEIQLNVDGTAGPFAVTAPNAGTEVWEHGASETVTWNVASTDVAPIRCSEVDLDLSIDGGMTYPISLAMATANDGTENVTVPSEISNGARVRVRCSKQRNTADTLDVTDHFFFDISDADFTVQPMAPAGCVTSLVVQVIGDSGACTLRDTVAMAPSGSTITFDPAIGGATITLASEILISGKDLTIDGQDRDVTIRGGGDTRLFRFTGTSDLVLRRLTLADGECRTAPFCEPLGAGGENYGGGVYVSGSGVTALFDQVLFTGHDAVLGGAVMSLGGDVTFSECTFDDNQGANGAAIWVVNDLVDKQTVVERSTFVDNAASGDGGAVIVERGRFMAYNSTFSDNSANRGGAIFIGVNGTNTVMLSHLTLANNQAASSGNNLRVARSSTTLTLTNNIVAGGSAANCEIVDTPTIQDGGGNVIDDASCAPVAASGDPLLAALTSNGGYTQTHALLPGSPAATSGVLAACTADGVDGTDQRGYGRGTTACSSGAFENGGTQPSPNRKPVIVNEGLSVLDSAMNGEIVGTIRTLDPDGDDVTLAITGQTSVPAGAPMGVFALDPNTGALTVADASQLASHSSFSLSLEAMDNGLPMLADSDTVVVTVNSCTTGTIVQSLADSGTCTLRDSVAAAAAGATLTFHDSLRGGTITLTTGEILIDKDLTLDGDGSDLTVSADGNSRVFRAEGAGTLNVVLEGLTLREGDSSSEASFAEQGGALMNCGEDVTLRRVTVESVSGNSFGALGANCGADFDVWDSTFTGNSTTNRGPVLYLVSGTVTFHRSTFYNNTSGSRGGAIYVQGGTLTINNSTLTGNVATTDGGAIYNEGTLHLNNATVAGNSGSGTANVYNADTMSLRNSILADALGGGADCANTATIVDNIHSRVEDGTCNAGTTLTNFTTGDPLLGPLDHNGGFTQTQELLTGSTAIDAGDNTLCEGPDVGDEDQRGYTRSDATCDLGAFEVGATVPVPTFSPLIRPDQLFAVADDSMVGAPVGTVQLDFGTNVQFSIVSGNVGNAFAIGASTGQLTVQTPAALDATTTPLYELLIQAQETAAPALLDQKVVRIRIWEPGMAPVITAAQSFMIAEGSPPGTVVGTVGLDQGAGVTFSLLGGNTDDAFTLDPSNGQLTVRSRRPIDIGLQPPPFSLVVGVVDQSQPPLGDIETVTVSVTDFNDPPEVPDATFEINSSVANRHYVGSVFATDPDAGDHLMFSITSGNTNNAFVIDPTTGHLFVEDNFGFDTLPTFTLTVQATDNANPPLSGSGTITVNVGCVDNLVTSTADSGPCTLRQAVLDAASGDTITFDPSLDGQTILLTSGEILIDKDLTIDGDGVDVSVSGGDTQRIFRGESPPDTVEINLYGFTLRDGNAGGGQGGAFHNCSETVVFRRMTIESNSGSAFGALGQNCGNGYTIWDSTFKDNSTGNRGAAIYLVNGTSTVHRSTFTGNSSTFGGGAVLVQGGTLILNNSTVTGNQSSNRAGAGVRTDSGGTLILNNVTVAGNTTSSTAGGNIWNDGHLTLRNSIVADALGGSPDCGNNGTIDENTHTLIEDGTCNAGTILTGFSTGDPGLGPLANNGGETETMAITGPPAKDTGDNTVCQGGDVDDEDQRGFSRSDATCDRGAYEDGGTAASDGTIRTWDDGGTTNDWSEAANWTGDTVPTSDDSVVFDTTSTGDAIVDGAFAGSVANIELDPGYTGTVRLDRSLTVDDDLFVAAGATLDLNGQTLSVDGEVLMDGTLRDVRPATTAASTVAIGRIQDGSASEDKFLGVEVTPTASMGNVQVEINTGVGCGNPSDPTVDRCFDVTPQTPVTADLRFYYEADELNGEHASQLNAFRYDQAGATWQAAGTAMTRSESDFACFDPSGFCWAEAGGVSAFSPFALSSTGAPSLPCSAGIELTVGQWRQISLACDPGPLSTVEELLTGDDDTLEASQINSRWAIHDWNETTESYNQLALTSPLVQGQSYWIKTLDPATIVLEGGNEPDTFDIPLVPDSDGRWNMVGHAFNNLEDWANVLVNDGSSDLTLDEADPLRSGMRACDHTPTVHPDCVMSRRAYRFSGAAYEVFDGETPGAEGELESLDGIFVRAYKTATLKIPRNPSATTSPSPPPKLLDGEEWHIRLSVVSGDLKDPNNVLGRTASGKHGFDPHDLEEIPPFATPFLTLVFPHDEWGDQAGDYATDFRGPIPTTDEERWGFLIRTTAVGQEVTLRWQGSADVLARSSLQVAESGEEIEISTNGTFTFTASGEDAFFWITGCDSDGDGSCDAEDLCPGSDDTVDEDGDGVPDGCDVCAGSDDTVDGDADGVPDGCDVCEGSADSVDGDFDGVPDGCDVCAGADDHADQDGDTVPDGCDVCEGSSDTEDTDGDTVPDGCDVCAGSDDTADQDGDAVPDGCDICEGGDDHTDGDGDTVPDACDICAGSDDGADHDGDGVPDGCDACLGDDSTGDRDGDRICADRDCDDGDASNACAVIFEDGFESGDLSAWR